MGKNVVTTFGKWDKQRQELFSKLISNPEITAKKNETEIKNALFDNVNSAMFAAGYDFVRANFGKMEMRQLTIESYKASLTVVLDSLSQALSIPKTMLDVYVREFCDDCEQSIEHIIKDMLIIGEVSTNSKSKALDQLYGETFKTKYSDLVQPLFLQDPEIIDIARKKIQQTIKPEEFGNNESIIREQLIYIDQVAPKVNTTVEFQNKFVERTGVSMEEYKHNVAAKNTSIWQNTPRSTDMDVKEVSKLRLSNG